MNDENNKKLSLDEKQLFLDFYFELKHIKDEYDVKNSEICQGLGVSRTPVEAFFNQMEEIVKLGIDKSLEEFEIEKKTSFKKLDINQASLLKLFNYITSDDAIAKRSRRRKLKEYGPNKLLKSARCQLIDDPNITIDVPGSTSVRRSQIQRVISRLSSIAIPDHELDRIFSTILDRILDLIGERGQSFTSKFSFIEAVNEILKFDTESSINSNISKNKFNKSIKNLTLSGKQKYSTEEIYELYFNIKETEILRSNYEKFSNLRIENCQFINLGNLSFQDLQKLHPYLKNALDRYNLIPERFIRYKNYQDISKFAEENLKKIDEMQQNEFFKESLPITQVLVSARFENSNLIHWSFISNHAHIDNVIKAILNGLGCPLKLKTVFAINLSEGSGSLVRVSVTLIEQDTRKTFHGMWVDLSVVVGISQATIVAIENWLLHEKTLPSTFICLYETSRLFSNLENMLHNYILKNIENICHEIHENNSILNLKEYLNKISNSSEFIHIKDNLPKIGNEFEKNLKNKYAIVKWIELNYNRKISDFSKFFTELKYINSDFVPSLVLYESENINFKFAVGDEEFLKGKLWRHNKYKILEKNVNNLIEYVDSSDENKNYRMRDYYTYLAISEIFGNIGRLEFYFCDENESDFLIKAAEELILAGYFASKIDLKIKTISWLSYASRSFIRLGREDEAFDILNIAKDIFNQFIDSNISLSHRNGISTEINLAEGELCLYKENYTDAALKFSNALIGSIYVGFARLTADVLYGFSKTCDKCEMDNLENLNSLHNFLTDLDYQNIQNEIIKKIIFKLKKIENKNLREEFKDMSIKIWNDCAKFNGSKNHIIANMIQNGTFLVSFRN